jgi:hypothetical protein
LIVTDKKTRTNVCTYRDRNMPPSGVSMKSVAPLLLRGKLHFHCTKSHFLVTRKSDVVPHLNQNIRISRPNLLSFIHDNAQNSFS